MPKSTVNSEIHDWKMPKCCGMLDQVIASPAQGHGKDLADLSYLKGSIGTGEREYGLYGGPFEDWEKTEAFRRQMIDNGSSTFDFRKER